MTEENLINEARTYAIEKHGSQLYGDKPYVYHLDLVFEKLKDFPLEFRLAAYLHDVIEDTEDKEKATQEIKDKFGEEVYQLVYAVSGVGANRKERKESMIEKLLAHPKAIDLKMADRLVNIEESAKNNERLYKMYKEEHASYDALFSKGNPVLYQMILKALDLPLVKANKYKA
jgi:guanosine-3',5'-bis(diphosphate) 3'-pyrophosphohydrolase